MKRWTLIAWALTLALAAAGIFGKERLLARGDTIYLRLAPVDPRSLMQGDYMALNFAIGAAIRAARMDGFEQRDGVAVIRLDANREPHSSGSMAMSRWRRMNGYCASRPSRRGGAVRRCRFRPMRISSRKGKAVASRRRGMGSSGWTGTGRRCWWG